MSAKKKQVSVLVVRTDLRTRPVNGLIYIRQPHVHHHEHPQLFSNFAEKNGQPFVPFLSKDIHPKETSDSGGRERIKKEKEELRCACAVTKKVKGG